MMSQYQVNQSHIGTIFGIIFFFHPVILAYRTNKWFMQGEALTGGRYFWRLFGWGILLAIPFVGWIYGFIHLEDIVLTRNIIAARRQQVVAILNS